MNARHPAPAVPATGDRPATDERRLAPSPASLEPSNAEESTAGAVPADASVVICAYTEKRWDLMLRCIDSVQRQSLPAREVIVVIDHNPDLLRRLRAHRPELTVVENSFPQGDSGAKSQGIATAHSSVVVFIDDDACAERDWLACFIDYYRDPNVAGVGGAAEPDWATSRPRWFPPEFDWVIGCSYLGMPSASQPVRNFFGCNMSFRREVLKQVGGFREALSRVGASTVGAEETELCIRILQQIPGSVLMYEPRAKVRHHVPAERARLRYFIDRCVSEGRSKARMTRYVGASDGLRTERTYALRTLPRGIGRGIADTAKGERSGITRSAAISAGLALTAAGYVLESAAGLRRRRR